MYAFLGDIHANREALVATLDDLQQQGIRDWFCLGDTVGAGGSPLTCLDRVRQEARGVVLGADDAAAAGIIDSSYLTECAQDLERHARELGVDRLGWIRCLPRTIELPGEGLRLGYGVPGSEEFAPLHSALQLRRLEENSMLPWLTVVGGTHIPRLFVIDRDWVYEQPTETTTLETGRRYVLCPGSVGQPHDYDHRASWASFDPRSRSLRFHRTDYDVLTAARKIRERSLLPTNAERLILGV